MAVALQCADHPSLLTGRLRSIVFRLELAMLQIDACLCQVFRKRVDTRTILMRHQILQILPSCRPQNCRKSVTVRRTVAVDRDAAGDTSDQRETDCQAV